MRKSDELIDEKLDAFLWYVMVENSVSISQPLLDCHEFFKPIGNHISSVDKFRCYASCSIVQLLVRIVLSCPSFLKFMLKTRLF